MFEISDNKGFHITFDNGYTVSVQFGFGNMCSNKKLDLKEYPIPNGVPESKTAETALMIEHRYDTTFVPYKGNDVQGYQNAKDILDLLTYAESLPSIRGEDYKKLIDKGEQK